MLLIDEAPLRLQPADEFAYSSNYWRFHDEHVLAARTRRGQRIPAHYELGLNGTHRVAEPMRPWWQGHSAYRSVAYLLIFAAVLVMAILIAGGRLELPS